MSSKEDKPKEGITIESRITKAEKIVSLRSMYTGKYFTCKRVELTRVNKAGVNKSAFFKEEWHETLFLWNIVALSNDQYVEACLFAHFLDGVSGNIVQGNILPIFSNDEVYFINPEFLNLKNMHLQLL